MYPMYSGSYSFLTETLVRFGVEQTFIDILKEDDFVGAVKRAIKPNTKVSNPSEIQKRLLQLLYFEVIANPTMDMPDLKALIKLANESKVCPIREKATPRLDQNLYRLYLRLAGPLPADQDGCRLLPPQLVCPLFWQLSQFSSKYIGGHTDVIAGCVSAKDMHDWQRLKLQQMTTGSALVGPRWPCPSRFSLPSTRPSSPVASRPSASEWRESLPTR